MPRKHISRPGMMAAAWRKAADALGFEFTSPFDFTGNDGKPYRCCGLVRHFGSPMGTLIVSQHDADFEQLHEVAEGLGFYGSALNPLYYERFDRARFMATLIDWRWHGPPERRPQWAIER